MSSSLGRQGSLSNTSLTSLNLQATQSSSMESLASSMSESTTETNSARVATLAQENAVLKTELEVLRMKCRNLQEDNKTLRKASVSIQAQAEQEEEFISNTLMKKIHLLKKEKEALAVNYEQEEEFLTNDLSRKLTQLRQEKVKLEQTLEQEQEQQVSKLMRKISKLEKETATKQMTLDQLRREKIDLENTLEQEQEMLVNRLWRRMDKVEAEKRDLETRMGTTPPPSPSDKMDHVALNARIVQLSSEVDRLKKMLSKTEAKHREKIQALEDEERSLKEENVRLQRKLLREMERREALSRQLSESESSLEMDDERHFNEIATGKVIRVVSSPAPYSPSPTRRSISPSPGHHRTSSFGSGTSQLQAAPHRPRTHSNASVGGGSGRQQKPLQNT
ncbi:coiled-coil domain-containing protein 6-like isoform X2 [Dysidea avara]|uniref:coiled-coil domain-containing protein 6-like isoform X2 n=1 Tax=Dysidea avara TaxID=196820 RepID=UPI0033267FBB